MRRLVAYNMATLLCGGDAFDIGIITNLFVVDYLAEMTAWLLSWKAYWLGDYTVAS